MQLRTATMHLPRKAVVVAGIRCADFAGQACRRTEARATSTIPLHPFWARPDNLLPAWRWPNRGSHGMHRCLTQLAVDGHFQMVRN